MNFSRSSSRRTRSASNRAERMNFFEPRLDGRRNFLQLAGEKMVRAFDDHEPLWFRELRKERFDRGARTEFIVSTLNDELWFCTSTQVTQVRAVYGDSETYQVCHASVVAAYTQADPRSEAETSQ